MRTLLTRLWDEDVVATAVITVHRVIIIIGHTTTNSCASSRRPPRCTGYRASSGVPRVIRGTAHARHQGFRASSAHGPWSLESSGRPSASERSSCSSATAPVSCTSTAPTRRRWLARVRRVLLVLVCSARPTVCRRTAVRARLATVNVHVSRSLSALLTKTDVLPSLAFVLCCASLPSCLRVSCQCYILAVPMAVSV